MDNDYVYPTDPVNDFDLTGMFKWGKFLDNAAFVLGVAAIFGCGACAVVSAGISLGRGIYKIRKNPGKPDGYIDVASSLTFGAGRILTKAFSAGKNAARAAKPLYQRGKPVNRAVRKAINRKYNARDRAFARPFRRVDAAYGIYAAGSGTYERARNVRRRGRW